eukprot:scaffold1521_cov271-Chaetoceros_neogracile.AAC.65
MCAWCEEITKVPLATVCIETMIKFIKESQDEVMGKFNAYFARLEGMNSHLHLIGFVETDPNSEEDKKEI